MAPIVETNDTQTKHLPLLQSKWRRDTSLQAFPFVQKLQHLSYCKFSPIFLTARRLATSFNITPPWDLSWVLGMFYGISFSYGALRHHSEHFKTMHTTAARCQIQLVVPSGIASSEVNEPESVLEHPWHFTIFTCHLCNLRPCHTSLGPHLQLVGWQGPSANHWEPQTVAAACGSWRIPWSCCTCPAPRNTCGRLAWWYNECVMLGQTTGSCPLIWCISRIRRPFEFWIPAPHF